MNSILEQPITLPCGVRLANRLAKSAMSEGLANTRNHSTQELETLYRRWARSGAGLLLSGNIQVDRWHLERPRNVVVDDISGREALIRLATAGTTGGAQFWAQLSHTGRQVSNHINPAPLSPSDVEIDVMRSAGFSFAKPQAMEEWQIQKAISQFAFAADEVKSAGFTGISLHAAHGYLISQFLSPLVNRRTDHWGGHLANRTRFLMAVISAVRDVVGPGFPIGIKLNASDFQKGGFSFADCVALVHTLNGKLDLLEISGGSLEQPKIVGAALKEEGEDGERTYRDSREAYFLSFASEIRKVAQMPVMVTGGFRNKATMITALENHELDIVGIGRPLIADPDCLWKLLSGEIDHLPAPEAELHLLQILPWNNIQLERLGAGLDPDLALEGQEAAALFSQHETESMLSLLAQRERLK